MKPQLFMLLTLATFLMGCGTTTSTTSTTSEVDHTITVYFNAKSPNVDWVSDGEFTYHIHYWGNGKSSQWNALPQLTLVGNGIFPTHRNG